MLLLCLPMHSAQSQFRENLKRCRELGELAIAVKRLTSSAIDVSDIWRAQIVLVVSALDQFIHELVRLGMVESAKGNRSKTESYMRFDLPLVATESAIKGIPPEVWVGEFVRKKHAWQSFQDPDKLADAIRLVSSIKLWESVGTELGQKPKDLKIRLKLIVDRRNQIAHEADLDPSSPGFRWAIDAVMVNDTIDFVERLGNAIFKIVL